MLKLPANIQAAAQRIAAQCGGSTEAVIERYRAAVKKSEQTLSDFFWGQGDISPERNRGSKRVCAARPRAGSRGFARDGATARASSRTRIKRG